MDMNDNDYITTLPKRGLKTRSYNMDMNKEDHITLDEISKLSFFYSMLKGAYRSANI